MSTSGSPWLAGRIFWNLSLHHYPVPMPFLRHFYDNKPQWKDAAEARWRHSSALTEESVWPEISWMIHRVFQLSMANRASAIFGSSAEEWFRHLSYAAKDRKMRRVSAVLFTAIMLTLASLEGNWAQRTVPKGLLGQETRERALSNTYVFCFFPSLPPQLSRWFLTLLILLLMCCPHNQNHRGMGMRMSACVHTGTHLQVFRDITSVHHQESVHGSDTTSETHRACCTKAVDKLGPR